MEQIIALLIPVLLLLFWLWMFWDMANNDALPPCFISITKGRDPRLDWAFAFVFLNIFTAGYYYFTEYKKS